MTALFFLAGIGGNLMSIVVRPDEPTVGASPAIFGLLAGLMSLIIVNWVALSGPGASTLRCCLIFMIIIIFVILLLMNVSSNSYEIIHQANTFGNMGGFFTGVFAGMFLVPTVRANARLPGSYEGIVKKIGLGCTFAWYFIFLMVFYLSTTTHTAIVA